MHGDPASVTALGSCSPLNAAGAQAHPRDFPNGIRIPVIAMGCLGGCAGQKHPLPLMVARQSRISEPQLGSKASQIGETDEAI
jgi:hypothetical protein